GWLPVDTRGHIAIGVVTAPEYLEHTLRAREPGRTSRLDSVVIGTDQVAAGGGDEHLAQAPADSLKRWPNENPEELSGETLFDSLKRKLGILNATTREVLKLSPSAGPATRPTSTLVKKRFAEAAVAASSRNVRGNLCSARLRCVPTDLKGATTVRGQIVAREQ